jgi:hypothetical protein
MRRAGKARRWRQRGKIRENASIAAVPALVTNLPSAHFTTTSTHDHSTQCAILSRLAKPYSQLSFARERSAPQYFD